MHAGAGTEGICWQLAELWDLASLAIPRPAFFHSHEAGWQCWLQGDALLLQAEVPAGRTDQQWTHPL